MKNRKSTVSHYVATWIGRLNDPNLSRSVRVGVAYAFSHDIHDQIVARLLTDREIYRELQRHLSETPARNLIRLHALPHSLVERVRNHISSNEKGASYSHMSYAMKLGSATRVKLLNTSMDEKLGFRAFKKRVDAITLAQTKRPTCLAKQVNKTAKRLASLLAEVSTDRFDKSLSRSDPHRRVSATASLNSAKVYLGRIVTAVTGSSTFSLASRGHLG